MTIFGGTYIDQQLTEGKLGDILTNSGPESVLYAVLSDLPLSSLLIPFYLFIVFISFVTAADSNISAMGGFSATGLHTLDSPEPDFKIKVIWGVAVGTISWIMISFAKIDGIKMLSNLGGVPPLLLCLFIVAALNKVARAPEKYDVSDKDSEVDQYPDMKDVG